MHKLDKNRKRVKKCPCGRSNKDGKFVPYERFQTVGYCHACATLFPIPIENKPDHNDWEKQTVTRRPIVPSEPMSTLPFDLFCSSLNWFSNNHLIQYLHRLANSELVESTVNAYYIGTAKHWPGATVFWQIDVKGKIRAGKVILYDLATGKRIKAPFNFIAWVHKLVGLDSYNLKQCFFGEHLLSRNLRRPVGIVESEKTALIASMYLPQFTWLATGSVSNLTIDKCYVLRDRDVTLFPDLNAYHLWEQKTKQLSRIMNVNVSEFLETNASGTDRKKGLDIADYLVKYRIDDFRANI